MRRLLDHGRQFIKFGLVGIVNSVIDFTVFLILHGALGFGYVAANGGAWLVAASFSFIGNKYWTFRAYDVNSAMQYVRFLIVSCIGLGISTSLLYVLVEFTGTAAPFAKALSIIVVAFWNFYANKLWTFNAAEPVWK